MTDSEEVIMTIPKGKINDEVIKKLIQHGMKICLQDSLNDVLEKKRKSDSDKDFWSLSDAESEDNKNQGKRKRKTKHLNDGCKDRQKLVGPPTKNSKGVLCDMEKKRKDVLSDIHKEGVLSGAKGLQSLEICEISEALGSKDTLDEYILGLDDENEFREEYWCEEELPSSSKEALTDSLGQEIMTDSEEVIMTIPKGKINDEVIKKLIQHGMKICLQDSLNDVLEKKRKSDSDKDFWSLSDAESEDNKNQGKRKRKTNHLNDRCKDRQKLVGPPTKNSKGVLCDMEKKRKDVLSDIHKEGVLSGAKGLQSLEICEISEALGSKDTLDEYILGLDDENEFREEYWVEEELPSSSKEALTDSLGEEMFSPYNMHHLRSAYRWPMDHVAQFIEK
ncbi:hypothetical protein NDU88_006975, partial [Pleurodeles waltl]